jgi:mono/diheme cytochrome c family protein
MRGPVLRIGSFGVSPEDILALPDPSSPSGSMEGLTQSAFHRAKILTVTPRLLTLSIILTAGMFASPAFATHKKADEMAGAVLFRDKGCAHCHGAHGEGTRKAPTLVNIRKNKLWTPAKIAEQIQNGGQKMPPFSDSLSDAETAQIVIFLRAKHWPAPPSAPPAPPPTAPAN